MLVLEQAPGARNNRGAATALISVGAAGRSAGGSQDGGTGDRD